MPGNAAQEVDEVLLQEILGLAQRRTLYEISAAVLQADARKCVELVARTVHQGCDIGRLARDLVEHFRNLLVVRLAPGDGTGQSAALQTFAGGGQLLDLPDQEMVDLAEQARPISIDTLLDYFDFMAAGEEEIARSTTPRFALESALIRLAGLPKTLPVTEWIERLERLEAKASSGGRTESLAPRKEKVAAPAEPSKAMAAIAEPDTGGTGGWREFIAFVGREKKFLASHLESGAPLELGSGCMKIGVAERQHLAFLLDSDNLSSLRDLAKRFFAQDITVQIVNLAADGVPKSADPVGPAAGDIGDERSPMVKEALRIFGGSVRNVRRENN